MWQKNKTILLLVAAVFAVAVVVQQALRSKDAAVSVATAQLDSARAHLQQAEAANQQLVQSIARTAARDSVLLRVQQARVEAVEPARQQAERVLHAPPIVVPDSTDSTTVALLARADSLKVALVSEVAANDTLRAAWNATLGILSRVQAQRDSALEKLAALQMLSRSVADAGAAVAKAARGSWWSRIPLRHGVGLTFGVDATGQPRLVAGLSLLVVL